MSTSDPSGPSPIEDNATLSFERNTLRFLVAGSASILVVVMALDFYVLAKYGLPLFNSTLVAEGDFALPVVAGIVGIGAAYGYFRKQHPREHLFSRHGSPERKKP